MPHPDFPVDDSHDPALRSWVESANDPETDFPIQNLPFGVFVPRRGGGLPRIGVAIGDLVLDLATSARAGLCEQLPTAVIEAAQSPSLNALLALDPGDRLSLRRCLSRTLREPRDGGLGLRPKLEGYFHPSTEVDLRLPVEIGDYSDFYASVFHAANVGRMFRPENPLLPNYKYVPIGYHGRASSIVVSGTPIRRPSGQTRGDGAAAPAFRPSARLDYELEVGCYVGRGNALGDPIRIDSVGRHLFGLCLVNDWSARDIQQWEYQPLGPFLSKSFATTVSPWVVTMEALAPFRVPAMARPDGDPPPLAYLDSTTEREAGGVDLTLDVFLSSRRMRDDGLGAVRLSRSDFATLYWTLGQMVAHHASNGCNLRTGDLLASGTVSGPTPESRGSLLELTWRGEDPLRLPTGEQRRFLEDGDEVVIRGFCGRTGFRRIGFGECRGTVLAGS